MHLLTQGKLYPGTHKGNEKEGSRRTVRHIMLNTQVVPGVAQLLAGRKAKSRVPVFRADSPPHTSTQHLEH
jgi:hypothetical protein